MLTSSSQIHIWNDCICGTQLKTAHVNHQLQIWKKKLRIHRSLNTNIERKIKALESKNSCLLKYTSDVPEREHIWAYRKRIRIDKRRARTHMSTSETHLDRQASSENTFEHLGNAFGSAGVEQEWNWTHHEHIYERIGNTIRSTGVERKLFWSHMRCLWISTDGAFRSAHVERKRFTDKSRIAFLHDKTTCRSTGAERNWKTYENTPFVTFLIVTNGLRST